MVSQQWEYKVDYGMLVVYTILTTFPEVGPPQIFLCSYAVRAARATPLRNTARASPALAVSLDRVWHASLLGKLPEFVVPVDLSN